MLWTIRGKGQMCCGQAGARYVMVAKARVIRFNTDK